MQFEIHCYTYIFHYMFTCDDFPFGNVNRQYMHGICLCTYCTIHLQYITVMSWCRLYKKKPNNHRNGK